jgi:hypothetical protein
VNVVACQKARLADLVNGFWSCAVIFFGGVLCRFQSSKQQAEGTTKQEDRKTKIKNKYLQFLAPYQKNV